MGESSNTQVQTDVTITGGTICLKGGGWIYTATDHLWLGTGRPNVAEEYTKRREGMTRFITPLRI